MVQIKRFIAFFLAAAATADVVAQPLGGADLNRLLYRYSDGAKTP